MLILRRPDEALQRVDLAPGAHVMVRAATTHDLEAAKSAFSRLSKASADLAAQAREYALPFSEEAQRHADAVMGLQQVMFWAELGLLCFASWEGVCDAEARPLPINRASVAMLMLSPEHQEPVLAAIFRRIHEVRLEGNGSAASANGAPEAATATAPIAPPTAPPALPEA